MKPLFTQSIVFG